MRVHLSLDDNLMSELDRHVAARERSSFVEAAIRTALTAHARRAALAAAVGSIPDTGHDWDDDPAAWVREQRAPERTAT